jgi:hypothetical protein
MLHIYVAYIVRNICFDTLNKRVGNRGLATVQIRNHTLTTTDLQ